MTHTIDDFIPIHFAASINVPLTAPTDWLHLSSNMHRFITYVIQLSEGKSIRF